MSPRNSRWKPGASYLGAAVFSSLNELLEVGVDGVVIATPGALDVAKTVAALERGVAFYFLRKPLWSVEQDFNLNMAGHTTGCAIKESVFVALRRLRSILDPAEFVCGFLRSDDQRTSATEWNSKEAFPLAMNPSLNLTDSTGNKRKSSHEHAQGNPNRTAFALKSPCLSLF